MKINQHFLKYCDHCPHKKIMTSTTTLYAFDSEVEESIDIWCEHMDACSRIVTSIGREQMKNE